jgi:putative endonuclease
VHYVYILRCADGVLYIGETHDLEWRVEKHNEGSACVFTRQRRPVALVHSETFRDRTAAKARERQLKRWRRAKKEALIAGDLALLKRL